MQLKSGASLCVIAAGLLSGTTALAQDIPATEDKKAEVGITDIVVTAQRRQESLQRAAVAVNVVSEQELTNRGVNSPQDLTKLVPALRIAAEGAGIITPSIRGVGGFSGNPYGEPGVAFNLDGVYLARAGASNGMFYDLERVEVLKGPQGTLYGRNATAGAINVITRKPQQQLGAEGTLEFGNYDYWRAILALNAPLGENAALRVSGSLSRRDGYFEDGTSDDHTDAVRASLKLAPTSSTSVFIVADYQNVDARGGGSVFSPFLDPDHPWRGLARDGTNAILTNASLGISGGTNPNLLPQVGTDGFVKLENWGVSATIEQDLGGATLTFIPSYRKSESNNLHYSPAFRVRSIEESKAVSLEARLASKPGNGPFQWLIGAYYFGEDLNFNLSADQGVARSQIIPDLTTRGYAGFGQITFSLTDSFRVIGGLRYNEERKSQTGVNGSASPGMPINFFQLDGKLNQNKVTWKAGVEWDAGPGSLVYANVGTGFKAGGFYGSLAPNTYKPEILTAYTVGSKNRFFDNTLQLNAEVFYWDYKDKQVTHIGPIRPGGFDLITENAGKAEMYGVELDLLWQPTANDQFAVTPQYLHSRYKDFSYLQTTITGTPQTACPTTPASGQPAVVVDCSGRPVAKSPKWTINLSYNHKFDLSNGGTIDALIGTRIESSSWLGEEYLAGQYQKSNMVSNASLTWRSSSERFSIAAYIENIEDEVVKSSSFVQPVVGITLATLRPPRTYGMRAGFKF